MAITLNVSPVYDYKRGFWTCTWPLIPNGNQGDPFDVGGMLIANAEWAGTPGVGFSGRLEGTNDPLAAPASFNVFAGWAPVTAAGLSIPTSNYPLYARWIRPNITAGDGTTSMTVRLILVTQAPS